MLRTLKPPNYSGPEPHLFFAAKPKGGIIRLSGNNYNQTISPHKTTIQGGGIIKWDEKLISPHVGAPGNQQILSLSQGQSVKSSPGAGESSVGSLGSVSSPTPSTASNILSPSRVKAYLQSMSARQKSGITLQTRMRDIVKGGISVMSEKTLYY